MGTFRLYAGTDQQAHIEKIELKAKPDWLKGLPANQITFREWPVGQFIDWHPAPRRQFVIILSGQLEIGLGDGSKHVFVPKQPDAILDIAKLLTPPGFELVVVDQDTPAFYDAVKDAEYVMGLGRPIGGEFFRSAPKLKLVQLLSAGYDRVDIESARKAKVAVANNGGANAIAVSEHAIMLMLAVLKRLVVFHNDVVSGKWRVGNHVDSRVFELHGKTLGIVGLGNIGKKVARLAHAFDMNIQYYDIARLTEDQEDALGVRFVLFTELLRTSDIVPCTCHWTTARAISSA